MEDGVRLKRQMLERRQSLPQYDNNNAILQCSTGHGSHTPLQDDGDEYRPQEERKGKFEAQKQTIVSVDRERRDGCAKLSETSEWWTRLEHFSRLTDHDSNGKKQALARCSAKFCELTDGKVEFGENFLKSP